MRQGGEGGSAVSSFGAASRFQAIHRPAILFTRVGSRGSTIAATLACVLWRCLMGEPAAREHHSSRRDSDAPGLCDQVPVLRHILRMRAARSTVVRTTGRAAKALCAESGQA